MGQVLDGTQACGCVNKEDVEDLDIAGWTCENTHRELPMRSLRIERTSKVLVADDVEDPDERYGLLNSRPDVSRSFPRGASTCVLDPNQCFADYISLANQFQLTTYIERRLPEKDILATVIGSTVHEFRNVHVVAIRTVDGSEFLMNADGLASPGRANHLGLPIKLDDLDEPLNLEDFDEVPPFKLGSNYVPGRPIAARCASRS